MASKKNSTKDAPVEAPEAVEAPATEPKSKEPKPCQCFTHVSYYIGPDPTKDYDGSESDAEPVYARCESTTARRFAPGHDARLKGVLIKLHVAGLPYHKVDGGMLVSVDPAIFAAELGWSEFLVKAKTTADRKAADAAERKKAADARKTDAAEARKAKEDARNEAKAQAKEAASRKKPKTADPAIGDAKDKSVEGFHPVRIKVGNKVYDGTITAESTNEVTVAYKDGRGNSRTAVVKRADLIN